MERPLTKPELPITSSYLVVPDRPAPVADASTDELDFIVTTAGLPAEGSDLPALHAITRQATAMPLPLLARWLTERLIAGAGWLPPGFSSGLRTVRDSLQFARELIRAGLALHDLFSRLDTSQVGPDQADAAPPSSPSPPEQAPASAPGARTVDPDVGSPWRDRLVFDTALSDSSPVVQGTSVTVQEVVSKVVDGYSWAEILSAMPELTEDDIRACLSYCVEEEGAGLCIPRD